MNDAQFKVMTVNLIKKLNRSKKSGVILTPIEISFILETINDSKSYRELKSKG